MDEGAPFDKARDYTFSSALWIDSKLMLIRREKRLATTGMEILLIGVTILFVFYLGLKAYSRRYDKMLKQYEVLEKRFQLKRKSYRNKWGSEFRHNLSGNYKGYSLSLYNHYHGKWNAKQEWTSLSLEVLFAGEACLVIIPLVGDVLAKFAIPKEASRIDFSERSSLSNFEVWSNQEALFEKWPDSLSQRFEKSLIALDGSNAGCFQLSKGFLEYRESGLMVDDEKRARFQEALLLMGEFADHVSIVSGHSDPSSFQ